VKIVAQYSRMSSVKMKTKYQLPTTTSPGVYFFRDIQDRILYVGKAANLKKRLNSYKKPLIHIQGEALNVDKSRIIKMLETATGLDWQETGSKIEALILESQLIKKHRPPFNIMLRDDKQYFYVGTTRSTRTSSEPQSNSSGQAQEEFPRIFLTHQPTRTILSSSPATRNQKLDTSYVGPFTEGSSLKSTLKLLRRIFPYCTCKQKHHRYCLNYHIGNCLGFCCLKDPKFTPEQKSDYKKNIKAIQDILDGKKISVLKSLGKEMKRLAQNHDFDKAIELRNKLAQLQQVFENAKVIKELAGKEKVLLELQKILHLSSVPRRIEGYDVSNIQGQFATGSMVVFTPSTLRDASGQASSGQATYHPDKNEYRKFKIRTISPDQGGDVAMLKEMLTRRFNHPEWQFPDLIIIDGGKAQLNTALSVVPKNISVIALTKDDKHKGSHIFSGTKKTAMPLFDLPLTVKNLILFIDSEAHRFAISYYRKLHRRNMS